MDKRLSFGLPDNAGVQVRYEGTQAVEVQKFANGQLLGVSFRVSNFVSPQNSGLQLYL